MMNLEYLISLEYDLDRQQASWEYFLEQGKVIFIPARYFPITIFLSSIGLIIWGLFEQNSDDVTLLIGTGIAGLILSIPLLFIYRPKQIEFLSSLNRRTTQNQGNEYYASKNKVNIILTSQEFILKTPTSEIAWTWKALKSFEQSSTGFVISFFTGYSKFIPKSAFINQAQIDNFKHLIEQYKSNY